MKDYMLEVCVDSVESAIAAQKGGAKRLELCSSLIIGGTTPSVGLFLAVKKVVGIPINVLIRPRFGDFCYTESECQVMEADIRQFRELSADAVVIGALKKDGSLDCDQMKGMIQAAGTMNITLHRAFDVCKDPFATLEESIQLGIHTILTSGQQDGCSKGAELLKELGERAAGRIQILAGGGVSTGNLESLCTLTGLTQFHMSGKEVLDSCMEYRKDGVPMGLPGISEFSIWRTAEREIRKATEILERS